MAPCCEIVLHLGQAPIFHTVELQWNTQQEWPLGGNTACYYSSNTDFIPLTHESLKSQHLAVESQSQDTRRKIHIRCIICMTTLYSHRGINIASSPGPALSFPSRLRTVGTEFVKSSKCMVITVHDHYNHNILVLCSFLLSIEQCIMPLCPTGWIWWFRKAVFLGAESGRVIYNPLRL